MKHRLDISSTAIEKGIDLATKFLDKLIIPPVEETGLLIKDHVTMWRFKNQINMLNKALRLCEELKINPKTISLKLLCPLLEYSSLEEEEELQDKWAILLSNMVDSEQNIENHVFPYILSQISSKEFSLLENVYDDKLLRQCKITEELEQYKLDLPGNIQEIRKEVIILDKKISQFEENTETLKSWNRDKWRLQRERENLEVEIKTLEKKEISFLIKKNEPQVIPEDELEEFEISNLGRLGLIKYIQKFFANSQTLEIPYEYDEDHRGRTTYSNVDLEVDIESDEKYILSELGELFIKACKIKSQ